MTASRNIRPQHQADMLAWLKAHPEGSRVQQMAQTLGLPLRSSTITGGFARLLQRGLIGYVVRKERREVGAANYRHYYAREHCPEGAVLADEVQPLVRAKPSRLAPIRMAPDNTTIVRNKPKPPLAASDDFKAAAPRITERTKVTIWTPQPDPRAAKIPPAPPLFGTLSTGRAPEPRPWAAAVAGGAR